MPLALAGRALAASVLIAICGAVGTPALAQPRLPTLGDGGDLTAGAERRLGDSIIRELYRDPDYIDDPVLVEYVQTQWLALLAAARARGELSPELDERFAWEVLLGRDRSVNAFALPGGYLGVHLGLIGVVASRDELASVLAHELSHVTQRHIARLMAQQSRQTPLMIGAMILGALAASKSPDAAQALAIGGQALVVQNQLNFSRDMEREADRVGYSLMAPAGFAPQGFVGMFDKLQQANRLNDNGSWPYLRSHPLTTQRIADMQQRQQGLVRPDAPAAPRAPAASAPTPGASPELPETVVRASRPAPAPDLEALLIAARARVLGRPGVDVLRAWAGEHAQPGFGAQPLPRRAAALYAAALAEAQLRDLPKAEALAAQLATLVAGDAPAAQQARLLQAELALQAGQPARALQLLPAAPRPSAADARGQAGRAVLLLRAQAQTQSGQAAQAAGALQTWVSDHPADAGAWQALATAHAAQGQTLRALRAEGEVPMAHMDYAGAVDRWRAAQDFSRQSPGSPADQIEANIVDTRLRAAQEALRQQRLEEAKRR